MKTTTTLGGLTIIAMVTLAPSAGAQTTEPPVLSTVPTPSGAPMHSSQMSGLPLQVGDLSPGLVTVRVIRGNFAENIENQKVELQLVTSGQSREAVTSHDGRAEFSGLQVGQTVKARAVVDGEELESQPFVLPSEGGVRLVLVADGGQATSALTTASAAPSPDLLPTREQATAPSGWADMTTIVPIVFGLVTIGVATMWLRPARRR